MNALNVSIRHSPADTLSLVTFLPYRLDAPHSLFERAYPVARAFAALKARIDRRIWNLFGETWRCSIPISPVFRAAWRSSASFTSCRRSASRTGCSCPLVQYGNGILLETEGDSLMMIYRKPDDAVRSAIAMQQCCQRHAAAKLGEDTARADEILVTGSVAEAVELPDGCTLEPSPDGPPGANKAFRLAYPLARRG